MVKRWTTEACGFALGVLKKTSKLHPKVGQVDKIRV
jgi:hypothetical protein